MKNEEILECLDALGLALAEHDHQWTPEQRSSYERCAAFLATSSGDCMEIG